MYQSAAAQKTSTAKLAPFFKKFQNIVHALWINGTKFNWRNNFIENLLALKSKKESKNEGKTLFSDYPQILDQTVNAQMRNATHVWFSRLFQFQPLFCNFLLFSDRKRKVIKVQTKFFIKQVKFLPLRCTSFQVRSKPVQQNCLRPAKNFKKYSGF